MVHRNFKFTIFEKMISIFVFKLFSTLPKIGSCFTPKCDTLRKFTQTTEKKQALVLEAFINSPFFLQKNGKKFYNKTAREYLI